MSPLQSAIALLHSYTAGTFDLYNLMGPSGATARQHIMSALLDRHMPKAKSGVTAILREFYVQMDLTTAGDCVAAREELFRGRCRAAMVASEKRAKRERDERISDALSEFRTVLDNARANRRYRIGVPVEIDLPTAVVHDPHHDDHRAIVAAAWSELLACRAADLEPEDAASMELLATAKHEGYL